MIVKNILVHVDSEPRAAARLALALRLTERKQARLTGLFGEKAEAYQVGAVATWPSPHYQAARDAAKGVFEAATGPLGERAAFIDLNRGSDHEIIARFVEIARTFDLVVLGQTQDGAPVPAKLPEQTIVDSGRPTLVVPYVGTYADVGAGRSSPGEARAARRAPSRTPCRCSPRTATPSSSRSRAKTSRATSSPICSSPISQRTG